MNIQQIRNATLRITISGKTFLIDPCSQQKARWAASTISPAIPTRSWIP